MARHGLVLTDRAQRIAEARPADVLICNADDPLVIGMRRDLHPQRAIRSAPGCANRGAVQAAQGHRPDPAGQPNPLDDVGHGAHARELVALAGDEHDAVIVAGVDGERDGHVREDNGFVYGHEQQGFH